MSDKAEDMEDTSKFEDSNDQFTTPIPSGGDIGDYHIYQNYNYPLTNDSQFRANGNYDSSGGLASRHLDSPYPSWCLENGAPITSDEIKSIFSNLQQALGFQHDNMENMFDHLMMQLDSRSSRMSCSLALLSLHSDYIGGPRANYKKWYFMAHYELDENFKDPKIWHQYGKKSQPKSLGNMSNIDGDSWKGLENKWKQKMSLLTEEQYIMHLGLYLLIWGEANNVRFLPECICFIFKCALDYYEHISQDPKRNSQRNNDSNFLHEVITPIYKFIRNQQYKLKNGKWIRNSKDHEDIIGYDDINQFFWFPENLKKIKLFNGSYLLSDYPKHERFIQFKVINWNSNFYKTYKEKRTWGHLFTNFSRVWIIHIAVFWYYTSVNSSPLYTKNYNQLLNNPPALQVQWSIVSLAGTIASLISVFAAIFEWQFLPRKYPGSSSIISRLIYLVFLTIINVAPSVYILGILPYDIHSKHGIYIGIGQFVISIFTVLYLSIVPPANYFQCLIPKDVNQIKLKAFTASFPNLSFRGRMFSVILWVTVFIFKFFESYVFMTLSLRDPIRVLWVMDLSRCRGDVIFKQWLCKYQAKSLLGLLYITDLVLFFLDTYLWYVIFNCVFSIGLSFSLGISVFTPWRNIFARLPERIYSKLINISKANNSNTGLTTLVAQIWNSIIISMYREHLLSLEQVNKLVYQFLDPDDEDHPRFNKDGYGKIFIKPPLFFVFQDDSSIKLGNFFKPGKEAERRISFFAQSLSCPIIEPIPTKSMPSFTVLIPHYSEKILLTLKEIIKENKDSKVSVLDYLKLLNQSDWESFVQDTKIFSAFSSQPPLDSAIDERVSDMNEVLKESDKFSNQYEDLPYYYLGFKNSLPEYTLRTRIWSSLRLQTLYRTVSGFMNYEKAIKILYHLENGNHDIKNALYPEQFESELELFANRKFRLLLSLQRYQNFRAEEQKSIDLLFESFPNINACYLEEELDECTNEKVYYSTLLDIASKNEDAGPSETPTTYGKKYRIKLSGNPILGDGKSDNQNNAIIFHRGEYIQVIDANQDNYLEECLKIKSVLAEFEEFKLNSRDDYILGSSADCKKDSVAIVGAREYIFSENIGVLGDIAAAKEQTFGTLFARTLAEIGGKLHYGHPDFLNSIFMNTRGGISKAQKELHLNEDIYAGMMATCRGGRIKHCDYYQCGKGRDLGFNTILNFTIKIGAGMGEQILSREHYYLGTNLPIDRFLSFYYAHAGFHINNLFISLSALMFMAVLIQLGALNHETIQCNYDPDAPITDLQEPLGCYNLLPVLHWVSRFVLSVFICFFISFLPLLFQELIEKGVIRAFLRIFYHLASLSPLFEVFVCQVYAKSLQENLSIGGAKYIATGRGFATSRESFALLYSRYTSLSIHKGAMFFITVMIAAITMWQVSLLWFFVSFLSMCLAPLLFNPHQFSWREFFLDYRELIRWFSRGNSRWHNNSWYGYQKLQRIKISGYKKMDLDVLSQRETLSKSSLNNRRQIAFTHRVVEQVLLPLLPITFTFVAYMFINSQTGVNPRDVKPVNPAFRILILSILPISLNAVVLLIGFSVSTIFGPIFYFRKFCSIMAGVVHGLGIIILMISFEIMLYCESFNVGRTLIGIVLLIQIHRLFRNIVFNFVITKEIKNDLVNSLWWSGKWVHNIKTLRFLIITQPFREFIIKNIETIAFSYDFILCHFLLFSITPLLFVPFVDKCHTLILFWSKPTKQFRNPIISKHLRAKQNLRILKYTVLYFSLLIIFTGLLCAPIILNSIFKVPNVAEYILVLFVNHLIQPNNQNHNDTGANAPIEVERTTPAYNIMSTVF